MHTELARRTTPQASGTGAASSTAQGALLDDAALRERARLHVLDGAVTPSYGADREVVLNMLNQALATELVCTLRYRRHYFMAHGATGEAVRSEFLQHSVEELAHADLIARRIVQLGGKPDFNPDGLGERSHAEYVEGMSIAEMVKEDLVAERIAVEAYTQFIRFIGNSDPTTRNLLEQILAQEENHAEEMASMLAPAHKANGAP
jgi:bacterioferritin